jgi:hypothetical protein
MRVAIVGGYPSVAPHWAGILEGLLELGHEPIPLSEGQTAEADFTIFGSGYPGIPSAFWLCDYIWQGKPSLPSPAFYSYRQQATEFDGIWLPQASIRRQGIDRSEPNDKIIFVGQKNANVEYHSLYDDRRALINALDAEVINGDTKDAREAIFTQLGHIYGNAGVVLGCDAAKHLDFGMSNRVWNVLGAGGFYCTVYTKGMETEFENGRHLVWGDTVEETAKLAKYYQSHQDEARKIAEEGFKLVQSKHLYKHRLEKLLSDVR